MRPEAPKLVVPQNALFLAPMAGVTDAPFRALCVSQGADFTVTEMVSAKGVVLCPKEREEVAWLKAVSRCERAFLQIFGSDPQIMAEMAARNGGGPYVGIDINMGCPAPKIVSGGDGSALLKSPELALRVAESVVKASPLPVSVKMRLGWDEERLVYMELGKALQAAGVSMITLHARTRNQMYGGHADWDAIGRLAGSLSIPVVGNGDVLGGQDALDLLRRTGCRAVMVGRGAMGNPFIFAEIKAALRAESYARPAVRVRLATALAQAQALAAQKGEGLAVREMRKHMAWYTKGLRGSAQARVRLNRAESLKAFEEILLQVWQENGDDAG